MPDALEPLDAELFAVTVEAVAEAHRCLGALKDAGKAIPKNHKVGTISRFDCGLPSISTPLFENVEDYSHVFGPEGGRNYQVGYDELPKLQALFELGRSRPRIREQFLLTVPGKPQELDEADERFFLRGMADLAHGALDRLIHTAGENYDAGDLRRVYCELERGILLKRLPVKVVVPLAMTKFDCPEPIALSDTIRLEPLSDELQLARIPDFLYGMTAHPCVLAAASHAIVLTGLEFESYSQFLLYTHDLSFYPQAEIDQVLDAIRVATGTSTGYAQVFMRPVGWAWDFRAHLPPVITGAIIRKYPADFDDGAWSRTDLPSISVKEMTLAGEVYRRLSDAPRRLTLAAERLSAAMLREHEADTILDLCIGLEAVLGDESPGDITYKLALRAAAVLSASGISDDPKTIFNRTKAIYKYRSAVAHGRPPESLRVLRDAEHSELLAVDVAQEYLRRAIIALSAQPELAAKPEQLDAGLILESLASLRPNSQG